MKAPALVGIVTALHILGITALVSIQGCGTTRTTRITPMPVEKAPPPTMPPSAGGQVTQVARTVTTTTTPPPTRTVAPTALVGTTYEIKKGDILSKVAQRHGVGTRDLAEYNGITNPNSLKIGQKLVIPPYAKRPATSRAPAPTTRPSTTRATTPSVAAVAGSGTYVVQAGDNLTKIARRTGSSVAGLKKVNSLTGDRIQIGDTLKLPQGSGADSAPTTVTSVGTTPRVTTARLPENPTPPTMGVPSETTGSTTIETIRVPDTSSGSTVSIPAIQDKPIWYTTVRDDTVEEIAKLFIVSKEEILRLNDLTEADPLTPGMKIQIPASAL